ncbi:hypothetical protein BGZ95_010302 [Linnemannia exigua]|uniref:TLC domain-containing protein n=1 Tax=Linnemannia exigua TaxID=604196 RepID=A0AAD4HAE0_9FUNG|nr:hypothetical protein BGZ95_010302 [Linnemannia exigua]
MVSSIFDTLGVATLEHHWTTLLSSAFVCGIIVQLSQVLCPILFPATYPKLQGSKKLNWDVHVVSTVHAIVIVTLAAPLLWNENLTQNKIFGYEYYAGQVYAVCCGYFLWDTIHSIRHVKDFGIGFVLHGICSFSVFIFSFRPFLQYFGGSCLMFELSTPFLNIHWFMDKTGLTGSIYQKVNGIILLTVFFCARIVFGFYTSYLALISVLPVIDLVPMHLRIIYASANIALNSLNVFWFYKMVASLGRRFTGPPKSVASKRDAAKAKRDQ